jgi:putative sigma-54 modulation protein
MKFQYTEKKVKLPAGVIAYAEKKVSKLDRYFNSEVEAVIALSVQNKLNQAELTLHVGSTYMRASEATSDMYASIDAVITSMERQIRKYKTKLARRLRSDAFIGNPERTSFVEETEDSDEGFKVVKTKRYAIKPMTVDEAILQMNLLNHTFFVFRNESAGEAFSVVYRRNDGDYGIITDAETSDEEE